MESVFLKVLNMSLSAAIVTVVVLLARLALMRAPKKWRYLLWIVVAFRLICPVTLSAPFSVLKLATQSAAVTETGSPAASELAYIPEDIGYMTAPRVYIGTPAVSEAVSAALPAPQPLNSANPLQIWSFIGTVIWCTGMAALLLNGANSYVNLKRRLRGAVRTEDGVFETDAVRAPFILGLLRPAIYLPVGLEGETLRYVMAHERFHIRRGDHAVKLLGFLLLTLHWFNPLVWLAFVLMCRDMEMRCDEAVLSEESGITKPYSMALLSFATARRFPSPSPLCFGETGVRERIKNVLRWRAPKPWVTVTAALLCTVAVAACAVNPNKAESTSEPTGTPWDWTSTVQLSAVKGLAEGRGITLNHSQMKELIRLLNAVQESEVVRGRGIPSVNTLDITTGVGYRLRWGGGIIELDFDDAAAAAELYGSPDTLGPGVWEIHNEALYDFLDSLEPTTPAASPTDLDATPAARTELPFFRDAEGNELHMKMSLIWLNDQLSTQLPYGYICALPQHGFSVAALERTPGSGKADRPVVELSVYDGWEISEGPGVGATAEEVRAYWGEPDMETDPETVNRTKLYSLSYMMPDGLMEFVHRGDGVIATIQMYAAELLNDAAWMEALTPGSNLTYWHGLGGARIEGFSCFGELYLQCSCFQEDGQFRMTVTDADGAVTVLAEGQGAYHGGSMPAPQVTNGTLDVTFEGDRGGWMLMVNWFPYE